MKQLFPAIILLSLFLTACVKVDLPAPSERKTVQYSLQLPEDFKCPHPAVDVLYFTSESPAKFKMLSRRGAEIQLDSFAKWDAVPSEMLTNSYRILLNGNQENARYSLDGEILVFERDLEKNMAVLKVSYHVKNRENGKVVYTGTLLNTAALAGDLPVDFANAMSQAFAAQAAELCKQLSKLSENGQKK